MGWLPLVKVAASGVTLDPANKSTGITLSPGNLVATCSGAGSVAARSVRSTTSHSSGQYYFEATLTTKAVSDNEAVGLANVSNLIDSGNGLGGDLNSIGFYSAGHVYKNNSILTGVTGITQGDVVQVAVDFDTQFVWFRLPAETNLWNDSGVNHPDIGIQAGGINISYITGAIFAGVELDANGGVWTLNFGPTFVGTLPTGFSAW